MSILNGLYPAQTDMQDIAAISDIYVRDMVAEMPESERIDDILRLTREGLTLADIAGLTKEQLDALLAQGMRFVELGQTQAARDVLQRLNQLDPTDKRAYYVIGTTYQLDGDLARAAHFYMQYIAFDATDPDGYLRLGECLLAAGETENARSALLSAQVFAGEGKGRAGAGERAGLLLAGLDDADASAPRN